MLTANIFKIKTQLGELNEQQIPELKEIENMVNEAEAVNMKLKEELNKVLDSIEGTEQAFLQKLALAVQNGAVHREEIPQLFKK